MNTLWFDLRYTLRLLARSPGFSALCISVIALALGLALTIYVLVNNQGMKSIPVPNGDRYVAVQFVLKENQQVLWGDRFGSYSVERFFQRSNSYDYIGAASMHGNISLDDGEITESIYGAAISPKLLRLSGVVPLLGRNLHDDDARVGADPVVIIGHDLWQNQYAGRSDIIGVQARIDSVVSTIIGVMPKGFSYPLDHHLWKPLQFPETSIPGENDFYASPIGILKEGISLQEARLEAATIAQELENEFPDDYGGLSATVMPYVYSASTNDWSMMTAVMISAAVAILLLACMNVGNLLLVRANERNQELVIRSALGGTRGRIIQQVLLESFLLCFFGGIIGLTLGSYGADFVRYQTEVVVGSSYLPFWMTFEIDTEAIAIAVIATLSIWLIAGGIPAWSASKIEISSALSASGKGISSKGNGRLSKVLVGTEVVCSFFLLLLSGAFVASVHMNNQADYGFSTENSITGFVLLDHLKFEKPVERSNYFSTLRSVIKSEPGVEDITVTGALPGMRARRVGYSVEDRDLKVDDRYPEQFLIPVARNYFTFMQVDLLEGRQFNSVDNEKSLPVVIVEKGFAKKMWPNESPVGKRLQLNPDEKKYGPDKHWVTIIGVISHIDQGQSNERYKGFTSLYSPIEQTQPKFAHFIIRYAQQPKKFEKPIKRAASRADRDVPLKQLRPLGAALFLNTKILQTLSELFVVIAMIGIVLAGTGIYGVVSRTVFLRTHEMGVRRALGFSDEATLRLFLRQGVIYLLIGAAIGGSGAILATYALTSEFPNLLDTIVLVSLVVSVLMTILVMVACYIPARRIIRLEPAEALRYE